jgi:hypothetical protein
MTPQKRRILLKLFFLRLFTRSVKLTPFNAGDQYNKTGKTRKELNASEFTLDQTRIEEQLFGHSDDHSLGDS